jgi:hypothetical protein
VTSTATSVDEMTASVTSLGGKTVCGGTVHAETTDSATILEETTVLRRTGAVTTGGGMIDRATTGGARKDGTKDRETRAGGTIVGVALTGDRNGGESRRQVRVLSVKIGCY